MVHPRSLRLCHDSVKTWSCAPGVPPNKHNLLCSVRRLPSHLFLSCSVSQSLSVLNGAMLSPLKLSSFPSHLRWLVIVPLPASHHSAPSFFPSASSPLNFIKFRQKGIYGPTKVIPPLMEWTSSAIDSLKPCRIFLACAQFLLSVSSLFLNFLFPFLFVFMPCLINHIPYL